MLNALLPDNRPIRIALSFVYAAVTLFVLSSAIRFMANEDSNKFLAAIVGIATGAVGVWVLYWVANQLISELPHRLQERLRAVIFVGPAIFLLTVYLLYPAVNTVWTSLSEDILPNFPEIVPERYWASDEIVREFSAELNNVTFDHYLIDRDLFEVAKVTYREQRSSWIVVRTGDVDGQLVFTSKALGWENYRVAFVEEDMRLAFRNNAIWLIVGTGGSVLIGLFFAAFVDRIKREALAKTFVFIPLAISMVGASVIWRFVYYWQPTGRPQIGILNAAHLANCNFWAENFPSLATWFMTRLPFIFRNAECGAVSWLRIEQPPINTLALIVIMIWLQTGFAMVILSAALKGVPSDLLEAARIDGANERQIFFRVILPMIRGSIITVTTTIFIAILKVFDIVFVMTRGQNETEVVANRMFKEAFNFFNFGRASALAVLLLVAVIPIIVINVRNLRSQGV